MKRKIVMPFLAVLVLWGSITSCSKKEESPNPLPKQEVPDDTKPPPPPPSKDTTTWFTTNAWVTKKIFKDGAEQANHFLLNSAYKFNTNGTYIFSIPNFPSASGTWVFGAATKGVVDVTNQGGTKTWTIISISTTAMVAQETASNGVWKYEFTH